jgi:hypothetical protein
MAFVFPVKIEDVDVRQREVTCFTETAVGGTLSSSLELSVNIAQYPNVSNRFSAKCCLVITGLLSDLLYFVNVRLKMYIYDLINEDFVEFQHAFYNISNCAN